VCPPLKIDIQKQETFRQAELLNVAVLSPLRENIEICSPIGGKQIVGPLPWGCVLGPLRQGAAGRGAWTMDETEELLQLCVRALAIQMIAAPGVELHMTRNCVLGLTDEPLADFNRLTLGSDPDAKGFLIRSVARAKERGSPLAAIMSPQVVEALAPVATQLGFIARGTAPLMVLRPNVPVQPSRPTKIVRALGPERASIAGDLIAAAFDEPRDVVARCFEACMTETSGVETYIAWGEEGPMCTVSVTPTGDTAGITLMATPPEHQRKGAGRALLSQVIADYRARGVERFHLGATEAGRPLYTSLGFELVANLAVWTLERSASSQD